MVSNSPSNSNTSSSVDLRQRILSLTPAQQVRFRQQLEEKGIPWEQAIGIGVEDLQVKSRQKSPAQRAANTPSSSPRPNKIPLSASQQHLWVIHKLYPETSAYHIAMVLRMEGKLHIAALKHSLQKVVNRHEALRTVFLEDNNQPYLKVQSTVEIALPVTELVTEENQSSALEKWQKQLVNAPFNLATGPLLRAHLFQLADNEYELVLALHHLIADGWSRGILLRELAAFYRCSVTSDSADSSLDEVQQFAASSPQLPALKIQYPDYVLDQQQWLTTDSYKKQLSYWQQQLSGLQELDLQTKQPKNSDSSPSYTSQTCIRHFSFAQSQVIKRNAQQSGTTVFVLLLAAFKLLLHRYSRQSDISVGIPVAGRSTAASESLIGFFVNTLVLRTQVESENTFSDWLRQVQATLADALQYQDVPFARVVDALDVQRTPGQNPLFCVMFQVQSSGYELQNAEQLDLQLPDLSLSQQWIAPGETKFDMSWHVIERDGQLMVAVEYRQALFERDRIEQMLTHFQTLVNAVITDTSCKLKDISLITPQEKQKILSDWSQGKALNNLGESFPARFEQQVKETPHETAVVDHAKGVSLTYQQLNQRANKLAHWLHSQGVGIDNHKRLVGIYLPSGIDLLTAMIATLKSGSAYVPLEVALPKARVRQMVQDAQPSVLITHGSIETLDVAASNQAVQATENFSYPTIFYIDKEESQLIAQPGHNISASPSLEQLAYIIYTSGSTGKPKGTQLTHRGLINYLNWCLSAYPLAEGCGAPVQSSVGFDATITSLFSPLLAGKQVVFNLADNEIEAIQIALSRGFSFIKLTPAHLSALQPLIKNQSLNRALLPKALIIGGEALHSHHIEVWQKAYPEVSLFNEYGPTEATVGCCVHRVTPQDSGNIPIGKPIDGAQLYVLDESGQIVPPGIAGELYIGGAGVAVGYLNRPSLTEDKFVQAPFLNSGELASDGRLYKTGDLVRYRADSYLDYLGRIDSQVKLRGFRIEPGEIEALLCQHPLVEQAAVILTRHSAAPQLAAYVVAHESLPQENRTQSDSQSDVLSSELRQQLSKRLPSYMVPTYVTVLEALPLTPNGKLDRSALPRPTVAIATPIESEQPRNEKEQTLALIWQQILGQDSLSIHDNFFSLGGDSISAMQIVSKANEQGLKLTPRQLFEHQTIAEQALVAQALTAHHSADAPVVGEAVLLAPSQQYFLNYQKRPAPHHYNQALLLTAKETIQTETLKAALEIVAQHHDAFRLRYRQVSPSQPDWQQSYGETAAFAFGEADLKDSEIPLSTVIEEAQSSLNLSEGPLFKAVLIDLTAGKRLLLVAHHLIVDGVSWRVLLADLLSAYHQLAKGQLTEGQLIDEQTATLPARTTAFGTWTQHLKAQTNQANIQSEKDYWTEVCAQASPLPIEQPTGQNKVSDTAEVLIETGLEQTRIVKSLARVDAVLLAALGQTLRQWGQQDKVIVDLEGHGRQVWDESLDLSRTVGWFTACYPFELSLPSGLDNHIGHIVQQLQQVPNRGIGYGMLRTYGNSDGQLTGQLASPAQVSFNYLGQLMIEPNEAIAGLAPEPVIALQDSTAERSYLFEIVSLIQSDQLQIRWRYSQQQYRRETIEQLCQQFSVNLRSLLDSRQSVESNSAESARFSSSPVKARQLNQLLGKLKAREGQSL
ncbi:MAG: amino acid adenylation domain-containing protein [Cyanobacteria bacterium J06627_28]